MKKRLAYYLVIVITLLITPSFISADGISVSENSRSLKKLNIEDFVDTSKPFETDNGELVDIVEYFENHTDEISPFVIIGPDGRKKVQDPSIMPYKPITYILIEFNDRTRACTGSLVDDYKILTNAHCLIVEETGERAVNVIAFTRLIDSHYLDAYWSVSDHIPNGYYSGPDNTDYNFDYGVVILEEDGRRAPGIEHGQLRIKQVTNLDDSQSFKVYGYPGDKSEVNLWGMSGNIVSQDQYFVRYDIDTFNGQSGSPVLNSSNELVAVHCCGFRDSITKEPLYNGGPKMTKRVVDFINSRR